MGDKRNEDKLWHFVFVALSFCWDNLHKKYMLRVGIEPNNQIPAIEIHSYSRIKRIIIYLIGKSGEQNTLVYLCFVYHLYCIVIEVFFLFKAYAVSILRQWRVIRPSGCFLLLTWSLTFSQKEILIRSIHEHETCASITQWSEGWPG